MRFGIGVRDDGARRDRSPVDSVTPEAAPSAASIRATSAPVRISDAGLPRRRGQRVGERAGPPTTNQPLAIGCPSPAPSSSSTRGAAGRPRARGTIRARRRPRSSRAAARSRTIRRRDRPPPSASSAAAGRRRPCPARETSGRSSAARSASAAPGSSIEGGGDAATARSTPLIRATLARNRGYCSASFAENARICCAARAASCHRHQRAAVERRRADVAVGPDDPQPVPHQPERAA